MPCLSRWSLWLPFAVLAPACLESSQDDDAREASSDTSAGSDDASTPDEDESGADAGDDPAGTTPADDEGPGDASDDGADSSTTDGGETDAQDESTGDDGTTGLDVEPPFAISNEGDFGPLAPTGLVLGPPNGIFDTDSDCTKDASLGICEPVATDMVDACVCRADQIVIGDLAIVGSRALVLLARTSVEVVGVLDVGGDGDVPGPGAYWHYLQAAPSSAGAAGGSHGSFGGRSSAEPFGEPELVPLVGGMDGQDGCGPMSGGGGGGALQISAGEWILVDGLVNAGGGGGSGGLASSSCNGGAGGGSGGAILLESLDVQIDGAIAANGGGGGSGGTTSYFGYDGDDASSVAVADGGFSQSEETCALGNTVYSGSGGAGATVQNGAGDGGPTDSETVCFDDTYAGEGGGGGGVGRIRVNTPDGVQGCICTGDFSPAATFGTLAE